MEAMNPKAWKELRERIFKQKLKSKSPGYVKLKEGEEVLLKKYPARKKYEPRYQGKGKIVKETGHDTYEVMVNGKTIKRHCSQLKSL